MTDGRVQWSAYTGIYLVVIVLAVLTSLTLLLYYFDVHRGSSTVPWVAFVSVFLLFLKTSFFLQRKQYREELGVCLGSGIQHSGSGVAVDLRGHRYLRLSEDVQRRLEPSQLHGAR